MRLVGSENAIVYVFHPILSLSLTLFSVNFQETLGNVIRVPFHHTELHSDTIRFVKIQMRRCEIHSSGEKAFCSICANSEVE